MSRPQYGNDMDRATPGDIIRRARERAESGAAQRESYNTFLQRQAMNDPRDQYSPPQQQQQPRYPADDGSQAAPFIPPRFRPAGGPPNGGQQRILRPQAPPGFQNEDGELSLPISRPAPVPQWPLAGPVLSPASSSDSEPYRPPAGSQAPPRPPRPSKVPSMLDPSHIQGPTPVFQQQYQPQSNRNSENVASSIPETSSTMSRPSTLSSVGSIPDFPLPVQIPVPPPPPPPPPPPMPPRRSVGLGPPPSARRGASSFYSHLSYVSPIPEESPRSRSHASFASSAAMPESWGTPSQAQSPRYDEAFFDDARSQSDNAQSFFEVEDDGDESQLVRSASVGRRGRAALVTTQSREFNPGEFGGEEQRPSPQPLQASPFTEGTAYLDTSSNSASTVPSSRTRGAAAGAAAGTALTADAILSAYDAASATDPRASRGMSSTSPQPNPAQQARGFDRFSAIRRPPRLDIDAVREAESRGSLTSLPDLIRRATRLAASLDRGKRPASRFDDLNDLANYPPERFQYDENRRNVDRDSAEFYEKHQSGLSDMLAAFPPPAQAQSGNGFRQSIQSLRDNVMSWPLTPNQRGNNSPPRRNMENDMRMSDEPDKKKGRRCCGLPLWGFIILVVIIIILIAAAVILPLEFFVFRNKNVNSAAEEAISQCQSQVTCQNGGTNVVTNGFCSCICINGFTGFDCSVSDSAGCTTANIQGDTNINNVTVGDAIPRLLTQASTNFSIPLSGTEILSKVNAGNLSCSAQNALITFDGENTRTGSATDVVADSSTGSPGTAAEAVNAAEVDGVGLAIATITVMAGQSTTTTLSPNVNVAGNGNANSPLVSPTIIISISIGGGGVTTPILPTTTTTVTKTITPSSTTISSTSLTISTSLTSSTISTSLTSSTSSTSAPVIISSTTSTVPTTTATSTSAAATATGTAGTFAVTQEVLDFARVGVLLILQQESLTNAETAQATLQKFFSAASSSTTAAATNLTLSNGNTIDLVNFRVDAGTGVVGKKTTTRKLLLRELPEAPDLDLREWS